MKMRRFTLAFRSDQSETCSISHCYESQHLWVTRQLNSNQWQKISKNHSSRSEIDLNGTEMFARRAKDCVPITVWGKIMFAACGASESENLKSRREIKIRIFACLCNPRWNQWKLEVFFSSWTTQQKRWVRVRTDGNFMIFHRFVCPTAIQRKSWESFVSECVWHQATVLWARPVCVSESTQYLNSWSDVRVW